MPISFNYLKSLFDEDQWDVGVLTPELFTRANLHPVKAKMQHVGEDYSNDIHFNKVTNALVLIKEGASWDYTHYDDAAKILWNNNIRGYALVYTNFKEAAILAGLGVRAKNSLIYSYKFGFDCHIAAVRFEDEIIDLPTNKRINYKIWNRCVGCDDCANACPVGAIHNKSVNQFEWWLDSEKCENFIGGSNHPTIPSVKKFWSKNVYPEIPKEIIENNDSFEKIRRPMSSGGLNSMPFDRNGYTYDGQVVRKDGAPVNVPFCRECTAQPRCSKWNGKFNYQNYEIERHTKKGKQ